MYNVNVPYINLSTYNEMNKFNNIPPDIPSLNHVMCKNTYTCIGRKPITLLLLYSEYTSIINPQLLLKTCINHDGSRMFFCCNNVNDIYRVFIIVCL